MKNRPTTNHTDKQTTGASLHAQDEEAATFSVRDVVEIANHLTLSDMIITCESEINDFGLIERRLWISRYTVARVRLTFLLCRHGNDIRVIEWEPRRLFTGGPMRMLDAQTPAAVLQAICEWPIG
jgi:hypothetical protein